MIVMLMETDEYIKIKRFREQLDDLYYDLRERLKRTESSLETVAEILKDSQFDKFKKDFEKDKERMEAFCKDIEEFNYEYLFRIERTSAEVFKDDDNI